jgi:hypothetical protein
MRGRTKAAAIGVASALALVGAGCGSSDAADKPPKKPPAGDVDIDSKDGTVKYTDEHGNETEMNLDGSGASVPKGWPSALDPPDSVTILSSGTTTRGGEKTMTVLGQADGSIAQLGPAVRDQVTAAGFDITQDTSSDVTGGGYIGMSATKGDDELVVALAADTTSKGKVTITMTLTSKA